jgi:cystathionine beta-lyase/cystathionine gamma-synthase
MPIHVSNSLEIATRLEDHPMIESVNHPSLASHPQHDVAQRIIPKGTGMCSFVVKGGDGAALKFMRSLNIIFEATSLGCIRSLVECPFNSSHNFVPEEVRSEAGVGPGFVRMSIGIEDLEDIWEDIDQALAQAEAELLRLA